ncbi:uncharacterized protein LOC134536617 [Bacillus rossius redtenbacheri]|uniref:uncharacterized protein LOC134536617 n=1 Tax=Bacillus rossius redtenbacheri TaxID=93214 RepID=UPI002FDE7B94
MGYVIIECDQYQFIYNSSLPVQCRFNRDCCFGNCCIVNKDHRELWETWYFWFGVTLIFLFVLTSAASFLLTSCKRKQHNLIRIHNLTSPPGAPAISAVSGPGGIIQPHFAQKGALQEPVRATAFIGTSDLLVEDFAGPLEPPYPAMQPVTIVRGSAPPEGFRQTTTYTELVLPPGYVDMEHYKHPL